MKFAYIFGSILFLGASNAQAQRNDLSSVVSKRECSLHVWAQPKIENDITGFFPDGPLAAIETQGYKDKLARGKTSITQILLTPELLTAAVRESRLPTRFGVPSNQITVERDNATQKSFNKDVVGPTAPCRYGFAFQMVQFQKSLVYGRRLVVFYRFTDASLPGKPKTSRWYNSEQLAAFDPTGTDQDIANVLKDGVRRVIDDIVIKKFPDSH